MEILVLPEVVQNKIAAGEVVERPASVVKELAENAIDAGADKIVIEIENGGSELLRLTDNGSGMDGVNLALAVERHATSKIRDIDDIFHIRTLGFRGEALPSIGSVAKLTITTGVAGAAAGAALTVEGGRKGEIRPAPPRKGTVVEVRNLFYNTPARRKFMKSASAEVAAISETVTRLALAHPEISFRIDNNGRRSLELAAADTLRDRITALFGQMELLPVAYHSSQGLEVAGFVAAPPESRAQSRFVYTLLNGRWFRHAGLGRTVADAFAGNLPPRRYPFAVLNLTVDTAKVDVNAHPAKEVIRFENESIIIGATHNAVRAALAARHLAGGIISLDSNAPAGDMGSQTQAALPLQETASEYRRHNAAPPAGDKQRSIANWPGSSADCLQRTSVSAAEKTEANTNSAPRYGNFGVFSGMLKHPASPAKETEPPAAPSPAAADTAAQLAQRQWRFLGQAGGKYLVVETPEGLLLVDQHALHERWNYERLKNRPQTILKQQLLVPVAVVLSPAERAAAAAALPILRTAGFTAEIAAGEAGSPADGEILRITAYPEFISRRSLEQVCRDILAAAADTPAAGESADENAAAPAPIAEFRDRLLARLACRSAVLFGTNLPEELCRDLLDKLLNNYLPTCPHGRPTTITLTWAELAGRFGR